MTDLVKSTRATKQSRSGRGGRRPGAGRKPTYLSFGAQEAVRSILNTRPVLTTHEIKAVALALLRYCRSRG